MGLARGIRDPLGACSSFSMKTYFVGTLYICLTEALLITKTYVFVEKYQQILVEKVLYLSTMSTYVFVEEEDKCQ